MADVLILDFARTSTSGAHESSERLPAELHLAEAAAPGRRRLSSCLYGIVTSVVTWDCVVSRAVPAERGRCRTLLPSIYGLVALT